MKYLLLVHASALEDNGSPVGCEPADWIAYDKEVRDAGVFVSGESLADLVTATTVQAAADGQRSITTDGPFAETEHTFVHRRLTALDGPTAR